MGSKRAGGAVCVHGGGDETAVPHWISSESEATTPCRCRDEESYCCCFFFGGFVECNTSTSVARRASASASRIHREIESPIVHIPA